MRLLLTNATAVRRVKVMHHGSGLVYVPAALAGKRVVRAVVELPGGHLAVLILPEDAAAKVREE